MKAIRAIAHDDVTSEHSQATRVIFFAHARQANGLAQGDNWPGIAIEVPILPPREIQWAMLAEAIGYEEGRLPDQLMEDIHKAVTKTDLIAFLYDNIKME